MADDDDGMESFTVSEADLDAALNPGKWRRPTKHQQIYGMFADDSDDERGPRRDGSSRSGGKFSKNDSAPIGFVSGGVKMGGQVLKEGEHDGAREKADSDSDPEISLRPTFGASQSGAKQKQSNAGDETFAGLRDAKADAFATWERHTKGIGSKLLSKMGYSGKGLGSAGQGITEPVVAVKRPGRGALGAYGPEVKGPKVRREGEPQSEDSESENESSKVQNQAAGNWRRAKANKKQYKFKTVDEVIAEGGTLAHRLDSLGVDGKKRTKVIDMTGREQRVYSGYDAFRNRTVAPEDAAIVDQTAAASGFDVPELRHNLELLMHTTEENIIRSHRHIRNLQDRRVALEHDREKLKERLVVDQRNCDGTKEALSLVEEMGEKFDRNELSLEECQEYFLRLKMDYSDEWLLYNMISLTPAIVLPLLQRLYDPSWSPVDEPDRGLDVMLSWRKLLPNTAARDRAQMHQYDRLVWHAWVRRYLQTDWSPSIKPQQNTALVSLLRLWADLMPPWILSNLYDQLIVPKLRQALENWNPVNDTVPVHEWLATWVPMVGWSRFEPLAGLMLHKLGGAFAQWSPRDPSAKMILEPWRALLPPATLARFVHQHVLPKLDQVFQSELVVNPADQKLEPWHWVVDNWADVLGKNVTATLLLRHFFPKWHNALYLWLVSPKPNLSEIERWYNGWKSLFPPDLLALPLVKDQLSLALEQMNRVLNGGAAVAPRTSLLPTPGASGRGPAAAGGRAAALLKTASGPAAPPATFKELVEKKAADNAVPFLPVAPPKFREGRPIYWLGKLQVYLDGNVAFALAPSEDRWQPMGLDDMLRIAMR